ncbi:hypothetical protein [Collimonas antrihumi]|uniref:hypothetical protein n=1 Tax=Collimonas antrihumi TaxID=1940615 RepID=UPI001B8B01E5|nr:hypothetical protein [Collimonas antrihumi]
MAGSTTKQLVLKPQDLLVALKIAVNSERQFTYAELASELFMSISEVHSSAKRAQTCGLLARTSELTAVKFALHEFLEHGVRYVFPQINSMLTRGIPTALAGPVLSKHFMATDGLPQVWPDAEGNTQGIGLQPIYPSVPLACRIDFKLYGVMTLVDALRGGHARDREISAQLILEYIK